MSVITTDGVLYPLPADREDAERDKREICRRWLLSGAVSRGGHRRLAEDVIRP